MKKIIPVALVLALALALMLVPAFADTVYTALPDDRGTLIIEQIPPAGQYVVEGIWLVNGQPIPLCSEPFELSMVSEDGFDVMIGSCTFVIELDNGTESELLADLIVGESLPVDPDDSEYLPDAVVVSDPNGLPLQFSSWTFIPYSPAPDQPAAPTGDPADVFAIFSAIADWLLDQIPVILVLFWNAETSQLTVLGGLAILFVGIGLTALLVALVRRFFKFA